MNHKKAVFFTLVLLLTFHFAPTVGADPGADINDRAQEAFRKGKNLYDQRRYAEAFREWDAILPDLEGHPVKKTIEFLKNRVKDVVSEPVPAALPAVAVEKVPISPPPAVPVVPENKVPAPLQAPVVELPPQSAPVPTVHPPAGFKETLLGAEKKKAEENRASASEITRAQKERKRALKVQKEIDAAFASGKKQYESGRTSAALKEWEKIPPLLKDPESFKHRLESLRRRERRLTALKILKQKRQKKSPPVSSADSEVVGRMETLLEESNRRLVAHAKEEIDSLKSRQELEERKKLEEKARLEKDFESGKNFLAKGDIDRAAAAWEKALPNADSKKAVKTKLEELKETQRRQKEINEMTRKKQSVLPPETPETPNTRARQVEVETQPLFGDPRATGVEETIAEPLENHEFYLKKNLPNPSARKKEVKRREALEREAAAERKKAWIHTTFEEGRAMYESGHTREAFMLWGTLTPYLSKEREIKTYIKMATTATRASSGRV